MPASAETPEPPARTGPLRGGNPRGNPNLAPRCGARNRAGCPCQAPAIRGKTRCRLHGGKSTGPRTQAGLARLRASHTQSGHYTALHRACDRAFRDRVRRTRILLRAVTLRRFLPPEFAARLQLGPPELMPLPWPPKVQPVLSRLAEREAIRAEAARLAPWRQAIALARLRKHTGGTPATPPISQVRQIAATPHEPWQPPSDPAPKPATRAALAIPHEPWQPPRHPAPKPATPPALATPHEPWQPSQSMPKPATPPAAATPHAPGSARINLRDRLLATSTHDGLLDDAIRTLGWDWIADRIAGDPRLRRWLSAPHPSLAGPLAPPAIRWS